jgi:DNA-binding IclR family transcriptional regulator
MMPRSTSAAVRQDEPARRMERERDDKYFSKVIGKAIDTLELLRASARPLSLNELTQRVGLAKSSIFRILHTLEVAGYVERDTHGSYLLAAHLRPFAPRQFLTRLLAVAVPRMKEVSREFCETVSMAMRFDNHIEVVATVESPQLIRMGNTVGRILPPHASSLGKAITANQPEEIREALLRSYGIHRFTPHTITDEVELKKELERVRTSGFSTDREESTLEGCCFGAAIRDAGGQVVAALSISMPKMRLVSEDLRDRVIATIRRTADAVSEDLRAGSSA